MLITLLTTLLILTVVILLVLITVFQHGNEGGFGSALGGGNSSGFFGASGGANVIIRATWIFGGLFFLLATGLAWVRTHDSFSVGRELESVIDDPALKDLEKPAPDADAGAEQSTTEGSDSEKTSTAPTETPADPQAPESTDPTSLPNGETDPAPAQDPVVP
jgi:preprotein translocase subunit SecG